MCDHNDDQTFTEYLLQICNYDSRLEIGPKSTEFAQYATLQPRMQLTQFRKKMQNDCTLLKSY
jgi:hypothetical protein